MVHLLVCVMAASHPRLLRDSSAASSSATPLRPHMYDIIMIIVHIAVDAGFTSLRFTQVAWFQANCDSQVGRGTMYASLS